MVRDGCWGEVEVWEIWYVTIISPSLEATRKARGVPVSCLDIRLVHRAYAPAGGEGK